LQRFGWLQAIVHLSPHRDSKLEVMINEAPNPDFRWEPAHRGGNGGDATSNAFQMHPLIQVFPRIITIFLVI